MKIHLFVVLVCVASWASCENNQMNKNMDDSTTTSTSAPDTTTTVPVTTTTTITTTIPTTPTTTTPTTTTLTTTTPTTTSTTTTSTTTTQDTPTTSSPTTTAAPSDTIFTFNVTDNTTCLRVKFSFSFDINYLGQYENTTYNATLPLSIQTIDTYNGTCLDTVNVLNVYIKSGWKLKLNYTLVSKIYQLANVRLDYVVDKSFPNATNLGPQSVEVSNLDLFSANKDSSYKCTSESKIPLKDMAVLVLKNYQGEPFIKEGSTDFDTAIECPADISNTSKLVPIIVGSALAVLVVLVLIAYIIGRRKHRPGYQQV